MGVGGGLCQYNTPSFYHSSWPVLPCSPLPHSARPRPGWVGGTGAQAWGGAYSRGTTEGTRGY